MIYAELTTDCDVSIYKNDQGFHFYTRANLISNNFCISTKNETINECMWLRTLGLKIPDYVIENLRNETCFIKSQ
jgi:hypothetical protein